MLLIKHSYNTVPFEYRQHSWSKVQPRLQAAIS
jgi:hypothetical protein